MSEERLSRRFERMRQDCGGATVTLRQLLPGLGPRDHALVTLLVALCSLHPLPMPGVSIALALLVVTAGTRLARGLGLWLPQSLLDRPLSPLIPGKIFGLAARAFRRAEGLLRRRAAWLTSHPLAAQANGAAIVCCGGMLLIPLPPPTNMPPAFALLLISLGILESDGLFLALGYAAAAASACFFACIGLLGWTGVKALLHR